MKKILFTLFSLYSLAFSAGIYDSFSFTDEEEKYSLFFCNTATSAELVAIGLSTADYTAISDLRPIDSLSTVSSNINIMGNDMKRIREWSYRMDIPDHSVYNEYTALGIKLYNYNFLMALTGSFVGFTFLFFLVYLTVNIARGYKD